MKPIHTRSLAGLVLLNALWAVPAQADNRYIVRTAGGLPIVRSVCMLLGCNVAGGLDGALGKVFVITTSNTVPVASFLDALVRQIGIVDAEQDLTASVADSNYSVPPALTDSAPVNYFG